MVAVMSCSPSSFSSYSSTSCSRFWASRTRGRWSWPGPTPAQSSSPMSPGRPGTAPCLVPLPSASRRHRGHVIGLTASSVSSDTRTVGHWGHYAAGMQERRYVDVSPLFPPLVSCCLHGLFHSFPGSLERQNRSQATGKVGLILWE